jgi:ribosome-associated translation inhibitor RaiA
MDIPLELSFHNMDSSEPLKAAVNQHIAKLEQIYNRIVGCRVTIEMPHKSHRIGSNAPDVHVVLRVPGREIVVSRELARGGAKESATDAYTVLDDAFRATQQQLKDYRRIQQCDVKSKHADDAPASGS